MKILLACTSIEDGHRDEVTPDSHYPLGLAYIQSYMEHNREGKDEFVNLFLNCVPPEQCFKTLAKQLRTFKPDVLGISIMTHSRLSAFQIVRYCHKHYPDVKIVIGGMHVSVMWPQLIEEFPYLVACRGEGERTFHDLICAWEKGESIETINGIAYRENGKNVVTPEAKLIDDLDELPFPKHSLFVDENKRLANLLTSRGCPYKCNFCVLDALSRRKVRFRTGENIADEVEQLLSDYPNIQTIWIHDDAFMINKDRTLDFCEAIIRRGIKTQFIASARFRPINEEVVHKMKEAGFVQVLFGLETGADPVLKGIKKGISKDDVRYGQKLFSRVGIKATAFLIAGLPGETDDTIQETIDFIHEIQSINYLFYDDIGMAMIYPGTEMYDIAKATGKIDDSYWLSNKGIPYYTTEFGGEHSYDKLVEFKETIREAIALKYLFESDEGFLQQRKLIPEIIRYATRFPGLAGINNIIQHAINASPNFGQSLVNSLLLKTTNEFREELCKQVEEIIVNFKLKGRSPDEQAKFLSRLAEQREKDRITMEEYTERSRHITLETLYPEDVVGVGNLPGISSAGGVEIVEK